MIKPLIFTSLYVLAGIAGWGAYSVISEENTSLEQIAAIAKVANEKFLGATEEKKNIYRHKDENGTWVYSEKPVKQSTNNNYEKELLFLQSLPQEVLPTNAIKANPELVQKIRQVAKQENGSSKLMNEAKRVADILEARTDLLNEISFGNAQKQ